MSKENLEDIEKKWEDFTGIYTEPKPYYMDEICSNYYFEVCGAIPKWDKNGLLSPLYIFIKGMLYLLLKRDSKLLTGSPEEKIASVKEQIDRVGITPQEIARRLRDHSVHLVSEMSIGEHSEYINSFLILRNTMYHALRDAGYLNDDSDKPEVASNLNQSQYHEILDEWNDFLTWDVVVESDYNPDGWSFKNLMLMKIERIETESTKALCNFIFSLLFLFLKKDGKLRFSDNEEFVIDRLKEAFETDDGELFPLVDIVKNLLFLAEYVVSTKPQNSDWNEKFIRLSTYLKDYYLNDCAIPDDTTREDAPSDDNYKSLGEQLKVSESMDEEDAVIAPGRDEDDNEPDLPEPNNMKVTKITPEQLSFEEWCNFVYNPPKGEDMYMLVDYYKIFDRYPDNKIDNKSRFARSLIFLCLRKDLHDYCEEHLDLTRSPEDICHFVKTAIENTTDTNILIAHLIQRIDYWSLLDFADTQNMLKIRDIVLNVPAKPVMGLDFGDKESTTEIKVVHINKPQDIIGQWNEIAYAENKLIDGTHMIPINYGCDRFLKSMLWLMLRKDRHCGAIGVSYKEAKKKVMELLSGYNEMLRVGRDQCSLNRPFINTIKAWNLLSKDETSIMEKVDGMFAVPAEPSFKDVKLKQPEPEKAAIKSRVKMTATVTYYPKTDEYRVKSDSQLMAAGLNALINYAITKQEA